MPIYWNLAVMSYLCSQPLHFGCEFSLLCQGWQRTVDGCVFGVSPAWGQIVAVRP